MRPYLDGSASDYAALRGLAAEYDAALCRGEPDQGGWWLSQCNLACWYPSLNAAARALVVGDTPRGRVIVDNGKH